MLQDQKLETALQEWIELENNRWRLPAYQEVSQIHAARCLTVRNFLQSEPGQRYIKAVGQAKN